MSKNIYEKEHAEFVRNHAGECLVLLKSNGDFPLNEAGKIALYGSGGRRTVKGGTGSGEVNSRTNTTIEEGLKAAGFQITTGKWLDSYDAEKAKAKKRFMKEIKLEAKTRRQPVMLLVIGRSPEEPEYNLPIDGVGRRIEGDANDELFFQPLSN